MKFATIGTGWIVRDFITATQQFNNLNYTYCYSRSVTNGSNFVQSMHQSAQVVTSFEAMLDIDFVYIASPNGLHYTQAKWFLTHKIHVLLEKSVTFKQSEILELQQLANQHQVILMEAIKNLHCKQFHYLQQWIKTINVNSAVFNQNSYSSRMPDIKKGVFSSVFDADLGKGSTYDTLVYPVELAIGLFGQVVDLKTSSVQLPNNTSIQNYVILHHQNNIITVITNSKNNFQLINSQIFAGSSSIEIVDIPSLASIQLFDHQTNRTIAQITASVAQSQLHGEITDFINLITNLDFNQMNQYLKISVETIRVLEHVAEQAIKK